MPIDPKAATNHASGGIFAMVVSIEQGCIPQHSESIEFRFIIISFVSFLFVRDVERYRATKHGDAK